MSSFTYHNGVDLLLAHLDEVLRAYQDGLTEYQLIEILDQRGVGGFDQTLFSTSLNMFQAHFILFHALYQLRDKLFQSEAVALEIHCLSIKRVECAANGQQGLAVNDPLREYYLNVDNLNDTDSAAVDELLEGFWRRYLAGEGRQKALACLDLSDPVSFDEIKRQYRRLVMAHHPDRGGDTAYLQDINDAMAVLERCHQA